MSILEELKYDSTWIDFLNYKKEKNLLSKHELEEYEKCICEKKYTKIVDDILNGEYHFSFPQKKLVNKINKSKKRVVYTFNEDETMVLKVICFLLYRYDNKLMPNCYSFRKNMGVKQAIYNLMGNHKLDNMCSYKIDISNYFNSIPIDKFLPILKNFIDNDNKLYEFLKEILENKKVIYNGMEVTEDKGIMAGTPISPFLANIYLNEMDKFFYDNQVTYARYSDDIIIFGNEKELESHINILKNFLTSYGLEANEKKEEYVRAGEMWSFLGFSYKNGKIDLSEVTKDKIKGKIRRATRKIRRWKIKKEASDERAIRAMNRKFNKKFYEYNGRDLTWCRWFFPIINTTDGLKEIDAYMQMYLRYMVTGKNNKANYKKVSYDFLKKCDYKPLVHEYYGYKKLMSEE